MLNWLNLSLILCPYPIHCKYFQCNINIGKYVLALHWRWNATNEKKIQVLHWNCLKLQWNVTIVTILHLHWLCLQWTPLFQTYSFYIIDFCNEMPLLQTNGFTFEMYAIRRHYCRNIELGIFVKKCHYCKLLVLHLRCVEWNAIIAEILTLHWRY